VGRVGELAGVELAGELLRAAGIVGVLWGPYLEREVQVLFHGPL